MTKKHVKASQGPILLLVRVVREERHVRSRRDARRYVDRYTVEYRGQEDGYEYRKAFEVACGQVPAIPGQGTSDDLNALAYQA